MHLNWLNWFHFLILEGGLVVTLIDCMVILLLFLDVTKISVSTVSFRLLSSLPIDRLVSETHAMALVQASLRATHFASKID